MRPGIGGIRPSCTCFVYLALLFGLLAWSPSAEEECRDDQFQCNDGSCIQGNWACDGSTDCSDESDEFEENCPDTVSTRKKRYSTADVAIPPDSLLPCLPNYKRCPKEDVCIPIFKFCDKRTDCRLNGDEEGCSAPVSNCDSSSCSHACQLTPDGPECYCPYQKQPNNTKCTDIDMCSYPQFCDQHCISKEGKFSCACSPGYTLMRDLHCIAENVPRNSLPTLLIADFMRFHQVALNGMQLMPPVVAAGQAITTLDFNHRKQFACWLSYQLGSKISVMECLDLKNTSNSWKMKSDVSLDNVVQIAFDWITENWYLADKLKERIILCNSTMGHCRMVLDLAKYEIFSIRVDPTAGYIFILTKSSVLRARLDGSNLHVIHKGSKTNMERPQDMTLDFANRHVYWTDSQSMIVMRMDYDGHSPFVIYSRLRATKDGNVIKGFGISILQNKLFLTSQEPASLSAVHRFNYAEGAELLTRDLEYPYQVHVYHRVRQPDLPGEKVSPCTPDTCEHLCVVMMDGDTPTAKCLCAAGYVMGNDSKCKVNTSCPGELNCQDVVCSWPVACNVSTPCEEGYIRCPRGSCVPKGWWCDGQEDCSHAQDAKLDMADEKFCGQRTCSVDEFRCMDGNCMPREFLCDGQAQCADKSDEKSCHNNTLPSLCNNDEFRCNNGSCLKQPLRCNGQRDCPNGSDEEHCEKCEAGQFRCLNGQCIAGSSQCDGKDDCLDSSDENLQCFIGPNVTYHQCKPDSQQFHCGQKEKRCIPLSWKCDGEMDCVDHSDEAHCNETCDGPTKFQCHNNESCLLIEKACNGLSDCTDGSDELGCKSCEVWGVCSQVCTALPHNKHSCSCYPGYQLKTDGSCKPTGSEPVYIIFSNQHQMRRVELTNYTYASLVSGLKNTIALDFFYDKSYIFWTDVVDDKIFRGTMLGNSLTNIEPIIDVGLATTEGLAIDWIGENIYWVESNLDQIEVAKLDGSYRTTFIAGDMVSPRAIVVDPREGALFWTDWDSDSPRIETCSMSGQGRKLIFKIKGIVGAGWPNGLTIDYDFRRLYWIDARSDSIHTIKYDGSSHRLILKGHDKMRHPFALTLFGNYVYWTDWSSSALLRANKFNGSDVTVIQKTVSQPFDLQVYHPLRQPKADNPCGDNNGGCSHLCLIGYNQSSTCMCPHLFKLREDNMTCETDNTFLLFVKTSEIRGVDLQDANYNVIPTITIPNVDHPTAIDYDLGAERLYWADSSLNVINSAFINGSGVETIIDSGISSPHGFAIDWLSKNMYFSSQPFDRHELKASISVAKLNGAFRAEITPEIIGSNPQSLAVLPSDGYLFWADQSATATSIICRSKMDGTEGSVIVGNLSSSVSIQLDVIKKRLFWIELGRPKIYMSDIDGKNQRHLHHLQLVKLQAFTYYKDSTFYVSHNTGKLSRFSFTDIVKQMKHHLLREKTEGIMALKVFDHTSRINDSNGCSKDNGKCAQLCLPTGPSSFVCKCTAGYRINGTQCTSIDSFLMYSSNSEIHGISFDLNDTKTKALPLISKISKASSIDFNAATDDIYWVDAQSNTVSRVKRDLTKRNTIVHQEIRGIQGMAVDWISGNVYWTDFGSDVIEVVRLTNIDHRFVVIHGQINDPRTIVLHPEAGLLFWTDTGTPPKIERARLDGTERKTIVNTDIKEPFGLAIDYDRNVLYWCDHKLQKIEAIDIATGNRTVLLQGEPHVNGSVSLTFYDDHIYWLEDGAVGKIKRINLDGSNLTVVRSKLGPDMQDIKAYHTSKQKGDNPCRVDNGGCQEFCFHIGNGTVSCNCSYGKVGSDGKTCEGHDSFLLFSKVTDIASISLDENNPNLPMKTITNVEHLRNVIGLATDHKTKRIFFSDIQRGDIQYINFNSSIFHVVAEGVGSVEGLAYDAFEKYLYWTSYTNSSISRINPDVSVPHSNATVEKIIQLGVLDHPRAIAIDSCSYRMFWTNWHDDNPQIQRSFLNGLKPESIITNDIWTPNGLTIDHREQQLYWSDARLDKIERCDFDGKNRKVVVSTMPEHPFSLAVYGQYIYWTDWIRRAVMRSNKYDGSNVFWMKRNLERQPMGITVVAEDANNCTVSRCHNHGCEDICKVINERAQCSCKKGILLSDGQRCGPANASCGAMDFVCHNRMACIPIEKRCNNFSDCSDGSDESPRVCTNTTCEPGLFTCKNFACIHIAKFCDGTADCSDGSDELQCTCERDQFQCKSGQCIHRHYRCDRDKDCPDFDDELGCNMTCDNLEMFDYEEGVVSCNTTSQCIQESWICDGNTDCWDNNDENHCDNKTNGPCADNGFKCTQSGACIPAHWECDNDNDCGDHSDEENCNYTCEAHMFQCNHSKVCLPRSWECDGHPDCANHTDEGEHCKTTTRSCQDTEYHCNGTGRCIPIRWKCDGDIDCPNGEDEHIENGCPPVLCKRDEYMCKNRRCIRNIFVCDRDDDCGDNSDEPPSCVFTGCGQSQFQCKQNGTCIAENLRCNGFPDCPDHSDEANCTTEPPCSSEDSFKCDSGSCIHIDAVCDGQDNCGDASDEPENCHINECFFQHRMCSHECVDMKIGYRCGCDKGYKLREDGKTCEDINECEEWPMYPCSHFCINTVGSFHCTCAKGYTLANNGLYCKADGDEQPFLIVANRYFLKRVTFKGVEEVITEHLHNAVAVGFDYQEKRVYWTDVTSKSSSINRMKLPNGTKEVIHNSTVRNPDGLAIDWVGRNLYWCDKTTDTIEVSKLDGRYRKVLIKEGLQEPRALEVFPAKGYMFYTDWGESPHISRSYLDGSITEKIITEDLAWPNALTIDYVTEKIFWADASLDYIAMANLDGSSRHLIIDEDLPHTFAVTTFMNYIYWTDWEKGSIIRAQKFSGENRTVVATVIHRLMDIQVYHKMRQVEFVPNPCENNGGCSHLCLLRPLSGVFAILGIASIERVCACPENHDLLADGRTCLANCTSSQFLCTRSSKCIPFWWKCDRQWDCEDGSDEPANCPEYKCSHPGLFRCKNSTMECLAPDDICNGKQECSDGSDEEDCESFHCLAGSRKCPGDDICMPESNFCDSKDDCPGGKDEHNCTHLPCNKNNFQCKNKRCLPYMWLCDKDQDCGDGSDESDDFCYNRTCLPGHAKCDTGRCIPENWQCDGDLDCGQPDDHSDEDMSKCNKTTCDPTYFQCDNKHCIPGRWQCDYDNDCRDGSDERGCAHRVCTEHEFNCSNNKCIPKSWQCNGEMNCEDGSDERDCVGRACNTTEEFQCGGICITKKWLCDDDIDCPDGSDERNCANSCSVGKFLCKNKHCVPEMWRCDGDDDCGDGTDEDVNMCKDYPCPLGRFRCNNHKCSFMSNRCDGVDQCGDGTDEENCYYDTICHGQSFRCQKNDKCIPIHKVCDGEHNCMDHSDEATAICSPDNIRPICTKSNRCQQLCQNILGVGYKCGCKTGYKLSDNGYSCHEINLCQIWGTCSQGCSLLQTLPRHLYLKTNCSCDQGYFMGTDNETLRPTCRARGPKPQLVIAHETELIQSDITRGNNGEEQQTLLGGAHEHSKILSIDVDMSATSPLWTGFIISYDKTLKKMTIDASNMAKTNTPNKKTKPLMRKRRSNIDLKVSDPQKFVEGVADPKGIAVDWVGKSVYWTDAGTHTIEMTDYLGNRRITLIDTHLKQPYSIVVAPEVGKLFWTDQGYPPKIQSSNLDGSGRKDVVKDAIIWPNGLVIDQANYRLYWTDTKKHTVETISLNGDDRHVVKTFNSTDPPFMIDVFEDYLYVTLYRSHSVVKIHKFGDRYMQKTEVLITNVTFIGDIIILQHNRQKSSIINYCATNSTYDGPCTAAFCVNMPLSTGPKYTCLCPNNAVYEDGKCSFRKSCEVGYCKNGGSCHPQANGNSKCRCQAGLSGERCEKCDSNNYCHNGGQCRMSEVGVTCRCLTNFTGARCESCIESACQNGGTCQIVQGQISCQCPNGSSGNRCQLANQCEQFCNNGGTCDAMSNAVDDPSSTKYTCTCTPDWTGSACDVPRHQCAGRCKNNGTCTMDKDGNARCTCIDVHGGPTCEACQCKRDHGMCGKQDNGTTVCMCEAIWKGRLCDESICDTYCSHGECNGCFLGNDSTAACKSCVCRPDYQGSRCEKSAQTQQSSENILLQVLVPVIAIILLLIIIIITLFIRKKRDQFKHHRMLNTSLETANPIFLAQQAEDENGDMSPMEVYDDDGDSTNFANPMYNRLYSSESTQVLLPKDQDNNEPYDGNGDIHYYNKNDKTNGKIAYA